MSDVGSFRYDERLDPEIAAVLGRTPRFDLDDIAAARSRRRVLAEETRALATPRDDVTVEQLTIDGAVPVVVRVTRPRDPQPGRGRLLWMHGGGHVLGDAAQDDWLMAEVVADTGATAVAVDWRRAPEDPFPAALDDCYEALRWLADDEHGTGPLVVGGASSGGGLAAGLAIWARDRGEVSVDAQLLIYPMLDDRGVTASSLAVVDPRVWNREINQRAWAAYLGGRSDVPVHAAPARAEDLSGLPTTWLVTAELDLFVDEDVAYASGLMAAGVSTELHVYPGAVHGFDLFAPAAAVTHRFVVERRAAFRRYLAPSG